MFAIGHRLCTAMCDTPTKKPLLWKRFGRWCRENPKQHFHQYRLFWSQDCLLFKIHPVRSIAYIGFAHGLIRFNLLKAPSIHVHTVGNVYVHQVLKNNSTKTNKHPAIPTLPRPSNLGNWTKNPFRSGGASVASSRSRDPELLWFLVPGWGEKFAKVSWCWFGFRWSLVPHISENKYDNIMKIQIIVYILFYRCSVTLTYQQDFLASFGRGSRILCWSWWSLQWVFWPGGEVFGLDM